MLKKGWSLTICQIDWSKMAFKMFRRCSSSSSVSVACRSCDSSHLSRLVRNQLESPRHQNSPNLSHFLFSRAMYQNFTFSVFSGYVPEFHIFLAIPVYRDKIQNLTFFMGPLLIQLMQKTDQSQGTHIPEFHFIF